MSKKEYVRYLVSKISELKEKRSYDDLFSFVVSHDNEHTEPVFLSFMLHYIEDVRQFGNMGIAYDRIFCRKNKCNVQ